jgi:hypothetical protein
VVVVAGWEAVAVVVLRDRAVEVAVAEPHAHQWGARHHSIVRAVEEAVLVAALHDRQLRQLGLVLVATLGAEIVRQRSREIDRQQATELAQDRDRPRCQTIDLEQAKGSERDRETLVVRQAGTRSTTIELALFSNLHDCQDLEMVRPDRGCRIKDPAYRTTWRTDRKR